MIVDVTPGRDCTQASATAAGVVPSSSAMRMSSSTIAYVRSFRKSVTRAPRSAFAWPAFSRVYLPDSAPPRSGDHGVTPMPNSSAIGMSSSSTVRSMSEYSIWRATSGVHPRNVRDQLRLRRLPGRRVGKADVADLARAHQIVERAHRLLDRRVTGPRSAASTDRCSRCAGGAATRRRRRSATCGWRRRRSDRRETGS